MNTNEKIILDNINAIEQKLDLRSLTYKNINYWPLVRFQIHQFLREDKQPPGIKRATFSKRCKEILFLFKTYIKQRINQCASFIPVNADFILLGIDAHRKFSVENKLYNPFTDAVTEFLNPYGSCFHIEWAYQYNPKLKPYNKIHVINASTTWAILLYRCKLFLSIHSKHHPENFEQVKQETSKIGLQISTHYISDTMGTILAMEQEFEKLFIKLKPKLLFVDVYYYNAAFSAILAAKKHRIQTVELQHGMQGKHHIAYGRWKNIPNSGYELMPQTFWVWDQYSYSSILEWSSKTNSHYVLLGGHFLYNLLLNKKISSNALNRISNKPNILITLNDLLETDLLTLKNVVVEAIKNSNEQYHWTFRFHPSFITNQKKLLLQVLGDSFSDVTKYNITIQYPHEVNLFDLLPTIDYHITFDSTVSIEALIFNIPTLILSENGKNYYNYYIEREIKCMYYVSSSEELLEQLHLLLTNMGDIRIEAIQTDTKLIEDSIKKLVFNG